MIREKIPYWYGEAEPDGSWAALEPGKAIHTDKRVVPLPPGGDALFLRKRGPLLACQGHDAPGLNWYWDGSAWYSLGPSYGVNPVAFDLSNNVVVNKVEFGSQGIRWIDEAGIHTGDATYAGGPPPLYFEYTTHGDITIGQGDHGGAVVVMPGKRLLLSEGDTRFIRFNRSGDNLAVAIVHPGFLELIWLTVAELANLPIYTPAAVPTPGPAPIPPPIQKEAPVPAYQDNPTERLKALRAAFPTPLGPTHAEFLIAACKVVGGGAGLLKKESGTFVTLPDGRKVSQDWIVFPDGFGTDFLSDGEGSAVPSWGVLQEYDKSRYVDVAGIKVEEPSKPPTKEEVDLGPILGRLTKLEGLVGQLAETLQVINQSIAELASKPEPKYEVHADCGRTWGHAHPVTVTLTKVG